MRRQFSAWRRRNSAVNMIGWYGSFRGRLVRSNDSKCNGRMLVPRRRSRSLAIMVKCFIGWKKFLPARPCLTAPGDRESIRTKHEHIPRIPMGTAAPQPTLNRLRQTLAGIDPSNAPRLAGEERLVGLAAPIDAALGGGLACGALHELAPAAPMHLGGRERLCLGACGARERRPRGEVLWIATDFAAGEGGGPYGPGLDLFGLAVGAPPGAARAAAGRCALGDGGGAALPRARLRHRRTDRRGRGGRSHRDAPARARRARRRQRANSGLGLLIRHRATPMPSAAATRWEIAAAPSQPDAYRRPRPRALRPFSSQEPARTRPAGGSSSGIIMSVLSSRRYLSVWLRRLSTDRIERRSSAPAEAFASSSRRSSPRSASPR